MIRSRTAGALLAISAGALVLGACNSDSDSDNGDGGGGASGGGASGAVTVTAADFSFDPADVKATADEDTTIELDNTGAVEHNWTVIELGTTIKDESEIDSAVEKGGVETIAAGEKGSGTVNLAAGTYQVICTIEGHLSAGMEGELTVE